MTSAALALAPAGGSAQTARRKWSMLSILLLLFIAEMAFGGPLGVNLAGVPMRKLLMVALLTHALVRILGRGTISYWQARLFTAITLTIALWGILIPILKGTYFAYSVAEFVPLIGLLLVFPFAQAIREEGAQRYLEFANRCIALVAAIVILAWALATFFGSMEFAFGLKLLYLGLSGDDFGTYIGPMPDGSFRVMWITCLFFPFMLAYKNLSGLRLGWTAFYLVAIFATGTRSFLYASLFIVALPMIKRRPQTAAILTPIILIALLASSQLFEGVRLFQVASDLDSSSPRSEQFFSLLRLYADHPVIGAGFGAHADVIRSDDAPFSYELTYVALLAKLGTVGSVLAALVAATTLAKAFHVFRGKGVEITMLAVSFFFITATNPYLLNSIGITTLSFMLATVYATAMPRRDGPSPPTGPLA